MLRLQEEYVYRFVIGIQGHYPNTFVDVEVEDEFMDDLINLYPYKYEKRFFLNLPKENMRAKMR